MPERPTEDEMLLDVTRVIARRGTCSRGQTGAVVALRGRILSSGYNGTPAGMSHCDHSCGCVPNPVRSTVHAVDCRSTRPCTTAVHAEANAVAFAARHGVSLQDATLYCVLAPCIPCAMLIINAGIRRVVVLYETGRHRVGDTSVGTGIDLLEEAGVQLDAVSIRRLQEVE